MSLPRRPVKTTQVDPLCACSFDRREFLRITALGSLALASLRGNVFGQQSAVVPLADLIPAEKRLDPAWLKSLRARGTPSIYQGDDLKYIGMPVGGLLAGQLYLGGDGKLWHWDIFNILFLSGCSGNRYLHPPMPASPLEQGFALAVVADGKSQTYNLDKSGFPGIRFRGEYPIATIEYSGPSIPVSVSLEAFSPFVPLSFDRSAFPATTLRYTVKNISAQALEATVFGWLENIICRSALDPVGARANQISRGNGFTFLGCDFRTARPDDVQPSLVVEDWNKNNYDGWEVEGTAFGTHPLKKSDFPAFMGDPGGNSEYLVNSYVSAPGTTSAEKIGQPGKLTSQPFLLRRSMLNFYVGGGNLPGKTCVNLLVDGAIVLSVTGPRSNKMSLCSWDIRPWRGKMARLEIVAAAPGVWGNIGVGAISQDDTWDIDKNADYGTMGLALLGPPADFAGAQAAKGELPEAGEESHSARQSETLIGALGRKFSLQPGESATAEFLITWHFKNLFLDGLGPVGRYYSGKFDSALGVARQLVENDAHLADQTRLWRDTWYDSSLPYWFLDRTFASASTLATSTPYRFADGRFYSWEGVGSCQGTCTHVWHYAHAVARLFPELESDTRHRVDLGIALNEATGVIGFRGEFNRSLAVDGQAGTLLRIYREHQMSPDMAFLRTNWERTKLAFQPLFRLDADGDGILEGPQQNTLDAIWYGKISWLSSLYCAALRAGEQMALEMGDEDFASRCGRIAARGLVNLPGELFNGEYFADKIDPAHPDTVNSGSGCEIDQVLGQSWAFQVGLTRVLPRKETLSALQALWKYNFAPNVGPYRAANPAGRWYAAPGEAGLLMCTFPRPDWTYADARGKGNPGFAAGYFNECMNGYEYQVAGHMIWEGMVEQGLAVIRAIHDRYGAQKRNPYNEIECGDHYSRSMAAYGIYLAACGFQYHGPKGFLAFAPRLQPDDFRAAFTAAEGWGRYLQKITGSQLHAEVTVLWGRLRLKSLRLEMPEPAPVRAAQLSLDGQSVPAAIGQSDRQILLTLDPEIVINRHQTLRVIIG